MTQDLTCLLVSIFFATLIEFYFLITFFPFPMIAIVSHHNFFLFFFFFFCICVCGVVYIIYPFLELIITKHKKSHKHTKYKIAFKKIPKLTEVGSQVKEVVGTGQGVLHVFFDKHRVKSIITLMDNNLIY